MDDMKKLPISIDRAARTGRRITAVVADDCPTFLHAVCRYLRDADRIEVVAAVDNGVDAVRETTLLCPEMVLLDVGMPGMSGPEAAAIIHANYPQTRVVMMSAADNDEVNERCFRSGACGFILKGDFLTGFSAALAHSRPHEHSAA